MIKEVQGIKVGIIRIAATIVDKVMPKSLSEGVYFTLGQKGLKENLNELKKELGHSLKIVLIQYKASS